MDSVTQLLLGAAVGEASAGRQLGRRAALWGAICGTLPDLDVYIPLGDAVRDFTYHRSASHSLFVLALLTPLMVWLIRKIHPTLSSHEKRIFIMVYLVFATHVLLDSFTVYGTQIFWPFLTIPMTWSTIFIIDPSYTAPLLIGVLIVLFSARDKRFGHIANMVGLSISTVYLLWSLGIKQHIESTAYSALQQQKMSTENVLTTPTPFNTLLWQVISVDDEHYYLGFYSIMDENKNIQFEQYPRSLHLLEAMQDSWPVQRLDWFTKGFYMASVKQQDVIITDLRMGVEPDYIFSFKVGEISNPHPQPAPVERMEPIRDFGRLGSIWDRIWDESAQESVTNPAARSANTSG